jgi:hypothetical protein
MSEDTAAALGAAHDELRKAQKAFEYAKDHPLEKNVVAAAARVANAEVKIQIAEKKHLEADD